MHTYMVLAADQQGDKLQRKTFSVNYFGANLERIKSGRSSSWKLQMFRVYIGTGRNIPHKKTHHRRICMLRSPYGDLHMITICIWG
jgi:hypothetical protein